MEIERKWIVKELPDLSEYDRVGQTRHFLYNKENVEVRVQKIGKIYEFERKRELSNLTRENVKFEMSKKEYEWFILLSSGLILRDCYISRTDPSFTIKIYYRQFKGLIRAEVEFESESEAKKYKPLSWFGREITNTDLGRDKKLVKLSEKKFNILLQKYGI